MSAPTFEVLAFAARVGTPAVAILELEGRFSDGGRRGLGRPRLLVERGSTQIACEPVSDAGGVADLGDGPWRGAFAVPLPLVQDASFALQIGRGLLVELPAPRLGGPDEDDGARLARLAREANDLRRRLDEAAARATTLEDRAAAEIAAAREQAEAAMLAAQEQAASEVAAAQEGAASEVAAAQDQAAAAMGAAAEQAATEVAAAQAQAAAAVAAAEERASAARAAADAAVAAAHAQAGAESAAVKEQAAGDVAAAQEAAAAATTASEQQVADALAGVDERIAAAGATAAADLARVREEADQAADAHARALQAARTEHAAQLQTTRLEAERLLDEALEVQGLRAAATQGELRQARSEVEFLRHGGLGAAAPDSPAREEDRSPPAAGHDPPAQDAGRSDPAAAQPAPHEASRSNPGDPDPAAHEAGRSNPATAAGRAREPAGGEDETFVNAPGEPPRPAPTNVPDPQDDAASRSRPWSAGAVPHAPVTAQTEIADVAETRDADATVRVVSGPRRPRHRAEDEEEPTRLSPGATRIGARSISPGTRTSRSRDPQRIGALVALMIAIAAFVLVVVLRVGPI